MTTYNPAVAFSVEHEAEGGLHIIHLSAGESVRGEEVRDRDGVVCGVVLVDEGGAAVDIEIFSLSHFDLDACAAKYGFADRAGAIGIALGMAVPA